MRKAPVIYILSCILTIVCGIAHAKHRPAALSNKVELSCPSFNETAYYADSTKNNFDNLFRFLGQNIRFPREARERHLIGNVVIGFEVNEAGTVADYKIGYSDDRMPYFAKAVTDEIKRFKGNVKAAAGAYTMLIQFRYEGEDYAGDKNLNYKQYDGSMIIIASSSTTMGISHR